MLFRSKAEPAPTATATPTPKPEATPKAEEPEEEPSEDETPADDAVEAPVEDEAPADGEVEAPVESGTKSSTEEVETESDFIEELFGDFLAEMETPEIEQGEDGSFEVESNVYRAVATGEKEIVDLTDEEREELNATIETLNVVAYNMQVTYEETTQKSLTTKQQKALRDFLSSLAVTDRKSVV